MLDSPQAHPAQSDLVLQFRKQCLLLSGVGVARPRRPEQSFALVPFVAPLVDMDRNLPIVSAGALRFVHTLPTPFSRCPIDMVSVARVHSRRRLVAFLRDTDNCSLSRQRRSNFSIPYKSVSEQDFFHANLGVILPCSSQPGQKLTVPIGSCRRQPDFGKAPASLRRPRRSSPEPRHFSWLSRRHSLNAHNDATLDCQSMHLEVAPAPPDERPSSIGRKPDPRRYLVLLIGRSSESGFLVEVAASCSRTCPSRGPLPSTAHAGCGSTGCAFAAIKLPSTDRSSPSTIQPPCNGPRSVQTAAGTDELEETAITVFENVE